MEEKLPRKTALLKMRDMIDAGADDFELARYSFNTFTQTYRALTYYRLLCSKSRKHLTECYVFQGPTGTGKSKECEEKYPKAYWKPRGQWWDGYCGQETVIIDDFYGWLPFDLILRLCDRYPLHVETKGGTVHFVAKKIIFTTNALPTTWYKNVYFPSFARRVQEWHMFPVLGMHVIYKNYNEACAHFFLNN